MFTGRFIKPRPAEVLFERICRENGITQRLTRPASPTTTGKIERLHQSLQNELLNDHGPFESLEALQAALDAWRQEYNTDRPHQSLDMAFPASRFATAAAVAAGTAGARPAGPDPATAEPDSRTSASAAASEQTAEPLAGGGGGRPGRAAVRELVDRRPAGLARPRPGRTDGHHLGRRDQPACPAGRHPAQDPALPARRHRAGPPGRRRRPPRRTVAAASRERHRDRGRADGQRRRPGGPGRRAGQCRLRARRAAGHAADGRHPDGRHQPRRHAAAHPALPGPATRPAPAARRPPAPASARRRRRARHRPAARIRSAARSWSPPSGSTSA